MPPPRNGCLHPGMARMGKLLGSPLFGRGNPGTSFFQSVLPVPCSALPESRVCPHWEIANGLHGNVSSPHVKIYTSLSPKCLRLEIERTVSWADLLFTGGTTANERRAPPWMLSYIEASHVLAISPSVGAGGR